MGTTRGKGGTSLWTRGRQGAAASESAAPPEGGMKMEGKRPRQRKRAKGKSPPNKTIFPMILGKGWEVTDRKGKGRKKESAGGDEPTLLRGVLRSTKQEIERGKSAGEKSTITLPAGNHKGQVCRNLPLIARTKGNERKGGQTASKVTTLDLVGLLWGGAKDLPQNKPQDEGARKKSTQNGGSGREPSPKRVQEKLQKGKKRNIGQAGEEKVQGKKEKGLSIHVRFGKIQESCLKFTTVFRWTGKKRA